MARIEKENVNVPVVLQSIGGDLRLKGREGSTLVLDGDEPHIEQIGEGQPYVVNCAGDCRIIVPADVPVSVQSVGSDAKLTDLNGPVDIQTVGSDLILRNVGDTKVKSVGSDLRIKWAEGHVTVENVGSDATIREIEGGVWIAHIGSDLYLRNVQGGCMVEKVGSDLVLNIEFAPDQEYRFAAGGDVLCRVPPGTNATLTVPVDTNVQLDVEGEITETDAEQIIVLGDGSASVYIEVGEGCDLRLVGEEEDYVINLGAQIGEELEARISHIEARISEQLEGLDERIQSNAVHWVEQAEKAAQRAQRQAERAVERVRRRMAESSGPGRNPKRKRGTWRSPSRSVTPVPPVEPVSEQERLLILQMVQENKITIEEAEQLLAALDS